MLNIDEHGVSPGRLIARGAVEGDVFNQRYIAPEYVSMLMTIFLCGTCDFLMLGSFSKRGKASYG